MNDQGPRRPVFTPEPDDDSYPTPENAGHTRIDPRMHQSAPADMSPGSNSAKPRIRTRSSGLDLEDPAVRAELARRLEYQRLKREREDQLHRELQALRQNANDDLTPTATSEPGRMPPPSVPPHMVSPQRLAEQQRPQNPPLESRSDRPATNRPIDEEESQNEQTSSSRSMTERPSVELDTQPEAKIRGGIRRFFLRSFLLLVVPVLAVLTAIWFYVHGGRFVVTENAYLKSNILAVSADLSGRVTEVAVGDNEQVEPDQLLFRVDAQKYQLAIAEADADLAVIARDVESLRGDYREALMENNQAKKRIEHAEREFARQQTLRDKQIGTGQAYDSASSDLEIAQSEGRINREKVSRALADLGGASDTPVEEHPQYIRALAARAVAQDALRRTEVRAPAAGIVTNMRLQAGEWVENGTPVFSIIDSDSLWIEANLKETQLTNIKEGQSVSFVVDAYPDHDFSARVDRIAPATGSEFALLPPQNATGNWVKVVQRIPLTLEIVKDESAPVLRAGMTAKVKIDSEQERDLPVWLRKLDKQWQIPDLIRQFLGLDRYQ